MAVINHNPAVARVLFAASNFNARNMNNGLSPCIISNNFNGFVSYFSIHFAGVFPQEADLLIHPDLQNFTSPVYLDRDLDNDDREKSKKYLIYLKKIDAYFRGEYTTVE